MEHNNCIIFRKFAKSHRFPIVYSYFFVNIVSPSSETECKGLPKCVGEKLLKQQFRADKLCGGDITFLVAPLSAKVGWRGEDVILTIANQVQCVGYCSGMEPTVKKNLATWEPIIISNNDKK